MIIYDREFTSKIKPANEFERYCKTEKLDYLHILASHPSKEKEACREPSRKLQFLNSMLKLF